MAHYSSLCQGALAESPHTSQRHPPAAPPLPSVWEVPATQAAERQTLRTAPAHVVPCAEVSAQLLLSGEGGQTGCEGLGVGTYGVVLPRGVGAVRVSGDGREH